MSSATWAVALIMIKILGRTESSITITAMMVLLMTPMSFFPALAVWEWPTMGALAWLLMIGIMGTIGQLTVTEALKEGDTNVVMPIDFLKLIAINRKIVLRPGAVDAGAANQRPDQEHDSDCRQQRHEDPKAHVPSSPRSCLARASSNGSRGASSDPAPARWAR